MTSGTEFLPGKQLLALVWGVCIVRRGRGLILLICLLVASAYGAQRFLGEGARRVTGFSPTHAAAAKPAAGLPPLAQRVVLVVLEGLRPDDALRLPMLEWMARQGAQVRLSVPAPVYQPQATATLLTGAPPRVHGLLLPSREPALSADTIAAAARRAGYTTGGAGDVTVGNLVRSSMDQWHNAASREQLLDAAAGLLAPNGPQLTVLHTRDLHQAAHRWTASPERSDYLDRLAETNTLLVSLLEPVDWKTTAVVVTGTVPTARDGSHSLRETVPLIMAGPGVKAGFKGSGALIDVAPTIAAVLGTSVPLANQGSALLGALNVNGRQADVVAQRTMESRRAFTEAGLQAMGSSVTAPEAPGTAAEAEAYTAGLEQQLKSARFAAWKKWLISIAPYAAGALLLVLLYLIVVWRQPYGGVAFVGTLAYAVFFHVIFLATGGRYSAALSGLEAPDASLLWSLRAQSAAAMAPAAIISGYFLSRKGFKKRSYMAAAASHVGLHTVVLVALPVAVSLLFTGWDFPVALPAPGLLVWFFVTAIQVTVVGYLSPVWVMLTVISANLSAKLWPLKETGDPERNADKVVRLRALRQSGKR